MKSSLNSLSSTQALPGKRVLAPQGKIHDLTVPAGVNASRKDGFVFVSDPKSEAAARYRNILAEIQGRIWPRKLMMITSPGSGEGKTLTAVNLALALDEKKSTVLLVELTLNRPRYRFVFGAPSVARGVEAVLRGDTEPGDVTFLLGDTGVSIMSVGSPMPDNRLLEGNRYVEKIIEYGHANFDWTILDVPSVNESRAVSELATQAEPVLMVARSHRTTVERFRKATHTLGRNLDYVILNDMGL